MAFLVLLAFQGIAWFNFWDLLERLDRNRATVSGLRDPLNFYLSGSVPFWIALMIALPALTMRLISEENRSGTIETLLTVPITEGEVVISKWLAGVVMYIVMLMPFIIYLPFLYVQGKFHFDIGPFISLSIGMLSLGLMFVAIGLFFSSLTRNQIVAAIWTFLTFFLFIFLTEAAYGYALAKQERWAELMQFLSVLNQVHAFAIGQLDLRILSVHFSICALMLFLTIKVVEWRRA